MRHWTDWLLQFPSVVSVDPVVILRRKYQFSLSIFVSLRTAINFHCMQLHALLHNPLYSRTFRNSHFALSPFLSVVVPRHLIVDDIVLILAGPFCKRRKNTWTSLSRSLGIDCGSAASRWIYC